MTWHQHHSTPEQHRLAAIRNAEIERIIGQSKPALWAAMQRVERTVTSTFRQRGNVAVSLDQTIHAEFRKPLTLSIIYAELKALDRGLRLGKRHRVRTVAARANIIAAPSAAEAGAEALQRRLEMTDAQLRALEAGADLHVVRVLDGVSEQAQRQLMEAVNDIYGQQLTSAGAIKAFGEAFTGLGLSPSNAGQIETIIRTQTMLGYGAGQQAIDADPDIQEILWGYTYVTAGDDRVREEHMLLDGTTLPKDDSFWIENWVPNGWNCRCQIVEVFEPAESVRPPVSVEIDGRMVYPGADVGFKFSPASLLMPAGFRSAAA